MNMRECSVWVASLAWLLVIPTSPADPTATNHPDEAKLVAEARFLMESWQYEKAIVAYKRLIEESTDKSFIYAAGAEAHVRIGECLYHLRRYVEAADWFGEALKDYPAGSARYAPTIKLADTFVKLGQLDKAREAYRFGQHGLRVDIDIEERIKRLEDDSQPPARGDGKPAPQP